MEVKKTAIWGLADINFCMDCLLCNGSARFHKIEKPKFNTTPCLGLADQVLSRDGGTPSLMIKEKDEDWGGLD